MQIKVSFVNIILDFIYVQGGPKKSVLSKKMARTPLKSIRKGKSWFRKIQHKCCRIGTKPFKISGEMAKKNTLEVGNPLEKCVKIHCIRFVPFLEGGCQLQLHVS